MGDRRRNGFDPLVDDDRRPGWSYVPLAILATLALILAIFGLVVFIQFQINDPKNIKHINGVPPNHGNVGLLEGVGMDLVDSPASSTITINTLAVLDVSACNAGISITGPAQHPSICNEGVLNVTAGNAGIVVGGSFQEPTISNAGVLNVTVCGTNAGLSIGGTFQEPELCNEGVLDVTAGTGITVTGTLQHPVVNNAGVTSFTAGRGLEATGSVGPVTARHTISRQTIDESASSPSGTVVRYFGTLQDVTPDAWHIVPLVVFPSDGGQGNINGTIWVVPTEGFYSVSITCSLSVNLPAAEDRVGGSIVLVLEPSILAEPETGILLPGGHVRTDISVGANGTATAAPTVAPTAEPTTAAPTVTSSPTSSPTTASTAAPTETASPTGAPTTAAPTLAPVPIAPTLTFVSATAGFQACANGCHITTGEQLYVYTRLDRRGVSLDALVMDVSCSLQTARLV